MENGPLDIMSKTKTEMSYIIPKLEDQSSITVSETLLYKPGFQTA